MLRRNLSYNLMQPHMGLIKTWVFDFVLFPTATLGARRGRWFKASALPLEAQSCTQHALPYTIHHRPCLANAGQGAYAGMFLVPQPARQITTPVVAPHLFSLKSNSHVFSSASCSSKEAEDGDMLAASARPTIRSRSRRCLCSTRTASCRSWTTPTRPSHAPTCAYSSRVRSRPWTHDPCTVTWGMERSQWPLSSAQNGGACDPRILFPHSPP